MWFTNTLMPAVNRRLGRVNRGASGYWMIALHEALHSVPNIELGIATVVPGLKYGHFNEKGIEYFIIDQPLLISPGKHRHRDIQKAVKIVDDFKPDIVHVHGTERFYGLLGARNLIRPPTVVSIQGLLSQIHKYYFGSLSWFEVFRSHRAIEIALLRGLLPSYFRSKKNGRREVEIIKGNHFFIGRTAWDKDYIFKLNPNATYFHVNEMLRPSFNKYNWDLIKCHRNSIIFTNASGPFRGVETLLQAVKTLLIDFPDIQLRIAGRISAKSGYGLFQKRYICKLGLESHVEYLGYLDLDDLIKEMLNSHIFVIPSWIENSPNSLCEAQLLGMPCIASDAGGIPSLVNNDQTGLLFSKGDSSSLVRSLKKILTNDVLAVSLGTQARAEAKSRHSEKSIIRRLVEVYDDVFRRDT